MTRPVDPPVWSLDAWLRSLELPNPQPVTWDAQELRFARRTGVVPGDDIPGRAVIGPDGRPHPVNSASPMPADLIRDIPRMKGNQHDERRCSLP